MSTEDSRGMSDISISVGHAEQAVDHKRAELSASLQTFITEEGIGAGHFFSEGASYILKSIPKMNVDLLEQVLYRFQQYRTEYHEKINATDNEGRKDATPVMNLKFEVNRYAQLVKDKIET